MKKCVLSRYRMHGFPDYLLSGVSIGLTLALIPSPLLALLINETLRYGRREGVRIALIPSISDIPIGLISVFVVYQLSSKESVFGMISILGGLFMAYLGIKSLRSHGIKTDPVHAKPQSIRKGLLVNFLNPNPYIFWFTVAAPTVITGYRINHLNPVAFLAGFFCCLIGPRILVAYIIGKFRDLVSGKGYRLLSGFLALVLVFFAVRLILRGAKILF